MNIITPPNFIASLGFNASSWYKALESTKHRKLVSISPQLLLPLRIQIHTTQLELSTICNLIGDHDSNPAHGTCVNTWLLGDFYVCLVRTVLFPLLLPDLLAIRLTLLYFQLYTCQNVTVFLFLFYSVTHTEPPKL